VVVEESIWDENLSECCGRQVCASRIDF